MGAEVNLERGLSVINTVRGNKIYECPDSGREVKATAREVMCFDVGDTGTLYGVDEDGDVWVKFERSGWHESGLYVVTSMGLDKTHNIEFLD